MRSIASRGLFSGIALLTVVTTSCVDEKIVFRDRELFEEPPTAAMGFLGYTDQDAKLTVCGNCHVGQQAGWETTGHADAWEGLQASGGAQEFCEGCHTVNELGNLATEPGGYNAAPEARYHDVQCESCHGPGLDHVQNPDASQPLAPMAVGLDLTTGCGECHSGTHHPFTEQWAMSAHGLWPNGSYAGTRDGCNVCHDGATALRVKFKETADYLEVGQGVLPATCAVCHDPHGSDFEANLRAPLTEASNENLCVTCHSRKATVTAWSYRGTHAPQGPLVLGEAGWIPPGFTYDTLQMVSSHGTEANPKLCATCHVAEFATTDAAGQPFHSVGHLFEATPCIDPDTNLPVPGPCPVEEEQFESCATGGCHGTPAAARTAFIATKSRMNFLVDQLWTDTDGDAVMETTDGGLLPRVLATEPADFDPNDPTVTVAKGAMFNAGVAFTRDRLHWGHFDVAGWPNGMANHKGSGDGVHNPFLTEALLIASIQEVQSTYGVGTVSPQDLAPRLQAPPGLVKIR